MKNINIHGIKTPDGKITDLFIRDSKISFHSSSSQSCKELDGSALLVIPGFIDTHIHGFAGYGTDGCDSLEILKMSASLAKAGTTSFFPTIYTDIKERMVNDIAACSSAVGHERGAKIQGIHVEGPFISPTKIGAQNPLGRQEPNLELLNTFIEAGNGNIRAMTMAPELKGIEEIASECLKQNIIPLGGHTDATYEEALCGIKAGITHFTHVFNAMTGLVHRSPGVVGAAMAHRETNAELIADGAHVAPASAKALINAKGTKNVIVITDALRPTEQREGKKLANGIEVEYRDGFWVTKGNPDLIQGSTLTMYKGFLNLINWGYSIEEAVMMTSTNAARLYGLKNIGEVKEGWRADLVLLDRETLALKAVMIDGEIICGMNV